MTRVETTAVHDTPIHDTVEEEPLFVTLPDVVVVPVPDPSALAGAAPGSTGEATAPPPPTPQRRPFGRRHRVALIVMAAVVVVVASGVGVFVYEWNHSGPGQLSTTTAYQRFRSGLTGQVADPGTLRPHEGVYPYRGSGHEHVSVPPKSQTEGPGIPGTVTYRSDGCWVWRLDYSDSHWQNSTFCARNGNLVEVGRAGWYRWNFVALAISDTATFTCTPEIAIPAVLRAGQQFPFSCTGKNNPIDTGVVTMKGTNRFVGAQTLRIGGTEVPTLHFREVSTFSGGQSGTNVSDLWFSTVNGLPVKGSWDTKVTSPTFVGPSTLTGGASFVLTSLTPRS